MNHLPHLILDLALILGVAAITTLLFKWLKQPLVLGYILAGFVVSPYFRWFPTVYEVDNIKVWAEIGVIFLLFSLGLEFSFRKLLKVGGSASITAVVEVVAMSVIGYCTGIAMGWSHIDSLFLGGILSISSTTIIIRAFDELGYKSRQFASLVFGVLIVEDLVAIILMVLLATLSVSQQFSGSEMIYSILKLAFFLVIWFVMGIFFIPTLLRKAKNILTNELLLVLSVTLCFGMVVLANQVGFSPALGAFVMGSILAETTKAERIEHLVMPLKDLFGAIFFVSVGMLINPVVLQEYAVPILLLCGVTIIGKILSSGLGALLSGQSFQTSIQAGFSLAQIGEFSFIIATLGTTLNVTSEFLYPIAVSISAVTTLTTPYLIKISGGAAKILENSLPSAMLERMRLYNLSVNKARTSSSWKRFLQQQLLIGGLQVTIIVSIILASARLLQPALISWRSEFWINYALAGLTFLSIAPFLWAFAIKVPVYKEYNSETVNPRLIKMIHSIKLIIACLLIGLLVFTFFHYYGGLLVVLTGLILLFIFSQKIQLLYNRIEKRFINNLNQRETTSYHGGQKELAPWNARIYPIKIEKYYKFLGQPLHLLAWREKIGINLVLIKRETYTIVTPNKNDCIFPGDEIFVIGTEIQVQKLQVVFRNNEIETSEIRTEIEPFRLQLTNGHPFIGKSIRATGLMENTNTLVVGLERTEERLLNPSSDFILMENDLLLLVGNRKKVDIWTKEEKPI
ncbi:cation:proton antiporter [Flavihumibacter sp. UBA7668]|uniref:cation:proton antiporter domain-containing protein n=1 Tax=Flavihumibacter sp. UBA7668 TaxID=1946542 RepID=UPI0025BEC088|nr:cation:proton antiporter [Flavihumibacter sp. UBA7668]